MDKAVGSEQLAVGDERRTETVRPTQNGWRNPAVEMPDDDMTVVIRRKTDDCPIGSAFHAAGAWQMDFEVRPLSQRSVRGWMHLHEAAAILDAAKGGEA